MIAFLLVLGIFATATIIGTGLVQLIWRARPPLHIALIAPLLGFAAFIFPALALNRVGLTVKEIAAPIIVLEISAACLILLIRRAHLPRYRSLLILCCSALIAALACGYPLFIYGWDWISFPNNTDFIYYCGYATHLLDNGFFQLPTFYTLVHNFRPGTTAVFAEPLLGGLRPGAELLMAGCMALTGLDAEQVYMPLSIAVACALTCSTVSLVSAPAVRRLPGGKYAPYIASIIAALCPLVALTLLGQLLPNLLGEGFIAAIIALATGFRFVYTSRPLLKIAIFWGILFSAVAISYPEILPFSILGITVHLAIDLFRERHDVRSFPGASLRYLIPALALGAVCAVLINAHFPNPYLVLHSAGSTALSKANTTLDNFPYFLIPSGFANLWSLVPISLYPSEPILDTAILVGMLMTVAGICWSAVLIYWRVTAGAMFLSMLAFGFLLFPQQNGFGLYKLVLYMQPFEVAVLSMALVALFEAWRRYRPKTNGRAAGAAGACIFIILIVQVGARQYYMGQGIDSMSNRRSSFVSITHGSAEHLASLLRSMRPTVYAGGYLSDADGFTLTRIEHQMLPASFSVFPHAEIGNYAVRTLLPNWPFFQNMLQRSWALKMRRDKYFSIASFPGHSQFTFVVDNRMKLLGAGVPEYVLETGPAASLFNRFSTSSKTPIVSLVPYQAVRNRLVDILLPEKVVPDGNDLLGITADPFSETRTFGPTGRYLLVEVLNPTPTLSLLISYTTSITNAHRPLLPISIFGKKRYEINLTGFGSMRIVTPPLVPMAIDGRYYFLVDLRVAPFRFYTPRYGLMRLYGNAYSLNVRLQSGFLRDVSALSPTDASEVPKTSSLLTSFPRDLVDSNVIYSGLYEDGWMDRNASVDLFSPRASSVFCFAADVPKTTRAIVTIDGHRVLSTRTAPFRKSIPFRGDGRLHKIGLWASSDVPARTPDTRRLSLLVRELGFGSNCNLASIHSRLGGH